MTDPFTRYARRVVRTPHRVGPYHLAACQRHLDDLATARGRGLRWDVKAAAHACEFFSLLRHIKGEWAGRAVTLEPWQAFIIGSLMGWRRDDLRRYRTAFVEVPRGNGKSTMVAGLALYMAFFDGEPGAEVYAAATKQDQARIVFDVAKHMVQRSSGLSKRLGVQQHVIYQTGSASKFAPLGADAHTLDGLRPHFVCIDEVHAHKDASVIDVLLTGMGTRRQPLLFEITTAGVNRQGPWWAHREYTRLILEGRAEDEAWFGFIAGATADDDWTTPAAWQKANPNYGISVKPAYLETECRKAQALPIYQNAFRRLHVGQLVEQLERVIDRGAWDACGNVGLSLADLAGKPCYGGLDLATTTDLSSLVLVWPDIDGRVVCWPWFWVPADTLAQRVQRDRVPYDVWLRQGFLQVTEGNVTDYDTIRAAIVGLSRTYPIVDIAYDPWNATQLALQLQGDGLTLVPTRPGYKTMNEPTQRLIALVAAGSLMHPGQPVLSWMADNLAVSTDVAGNMRPDKAKATERIDGMVALIMALSRVVTTAVAGPSVYESRDMLVL